MSEESKKHGKLLELSYTLFSNGMAFGTSSSRSITVEWKKDGTVSVEDSSNGSYGDVRTLYKADPGKAAKLAEFAEEKDIAGLSGKDIQLPMVYDNFTRATINVSYDESEVGGESYKHYHLDCGATGMTFKSIEGPLYEMLEELMTSGECIRNEEDDNANLFREFLKKGMTMTMDPENDKLAEMQKQQMEAMGQPAPGKWMCSCGTGNSGNFCSNCGKEKPATPPPGTWTCPACNTSGLTSRFCCECGSARP